MADQPTCKTCRYFNDTAYRAECRRRPPVVFFVDYGNPHDRGPSNAWPNVHDFDWCGEFESKEPEA